MILRNANIGEPETQHDSWSSLQPEFCDSSLRTGSKMLGALGSPWLPAPAFPPNWAALWNSAFSSAKQRQGGFAEFPGIAIFKELIPAVFLRTL